MLSDKAPFHHNAIDGVMDKCTELPFSMWGWWVCGIFTLASTIVGLLGCLTVVQRHFYSKLRLQSNTSRFSTILTFLCITDGVLLIAASAFYGFISVIYGARKMYGVVVYVYKISYPISNTAYTCSMWLTVLLVIERYMAICHPLKTAQRYNATLACVCVIVVATIFNVPTVLELRLVPCIDAAHKNVTTWQIDMSKLRTNEAYKMYYRIVLHWLVAGFMPVSCVIGMTLLTYRQIRQAAKQRSRMARILASKVDANPSFVLLRSAIQTMTVVEPLSAKETIMNCHKRKKKRNSTVEMTTQEWHITAQLLTISVKFILCYTPPIVYNLVEYVFADWAINSDASVYVVDVVNALVVFHSATNWLVVQWPRTHKFLVTLIGGHLPRLFSERKSPPRHKLTTVDYSMLLEPTTQMTRKSTAAGIQRITSLRPKPRDDEKFALSGEQAQMLLARWPDVESNENLSSPLEMLSNALSEAVMVRKQSRTSDSSIPNDPEPISPQQQTWTCSYATRRLSQRRCKVASALTELLELLCSSLDSNTQFNSTTVFAARRLIRHVGARHYALGITFNNNHWSILRRELMRVFVLRKPSAQSIRRRYSMSENLQVPLEASNHSTEDAVALAVIKLTTLLITELKHGALVAAVHAKDVNDVLRDKTMIFAASRHSRESSSSTPTIGTEVVSGYSMTRQSTDAIQV